RSPRRCFMDTSSAARGEDRRATLTSSFPGRADRRQISRGRGVGVKGCHGMALRHRRVAVSRTRGPGSMRAISVSGLTLGFTTSNYDAAHDSFTFDSFTAVRLPVPLPAPRPLTVLNRWPAVRVRQPGAWLDDASRGVLPDQREGEREANDVLTA